MTDILLLAILIVAMMNGRVHELIVKFFDAFQRLVFKIRNWRKGTK